MSGTSSSPAVPSAPAPFGYRFVKGLIPVGLIVSGRVAAEFLQGHAVSLEYLVASVVGYAIVTAVLVSASLAIPGRWGPRAGVLFCLLYSVMTLNIAIELAIFSTTSFTTLAGFLLVGLVQWSVAAAVVARLFASPLIGASLRWRGHHLLAARTGPRWVGRVVIGVFGYVLLYFIVGAFAFRWTAPFYTDPVYGLNLTLPSPGLVAQVQVVRALVYVVAVGSLIVGVEGPRKRVALLAGLSLFVMGGLSPLITNTSWPVPLRVYHTVEIFFQNFPLGVLIVYLLRPRVALNAPDSR